MGYYITDQLTGDPIWIDGPDPNEGKGAEPVPPERTTYYETIEDWKADGQPGSTLDTKVVVGETPPEGFKYTKPDTNTIVIGVETDSPTRIKNTPELRRLKEENPYLYEQMRREGRLRDVAEIVDNGKGRKSIATRQGISTLESERFVAQQEGKRTERLLAKLAPYKEGDGYRLDRAIADGVPLATVESAGFTSDAVAEAKQGAAFLQATPEERFNILQKQGQVPPNARFAGLDASGNVTYTVDVPDLSKTHIKKVGAKNVIKDVWRYLTPWDEQGGETYLAYMKKYPERVGATIQETIRPTTKTQSELKAMYEGDKGAPLWARLVFGGTPVVYDAKTNTYSEVAIGEVATGGKRGAVQAVTGAAQKFANVGAREAKASESAWQTFLKAWSRNSSVKPSAKAPSNVDWKQVGDAIKNGEIKNAKDLAAKARTPSYRTRLQAERSTSLAKARGQAGARAAKAEASKNDWEAYVQQRTKAIADATKAAAKPVAVAPATAAARPFTKLTRAQQATVLQSVSPSVREAVRATPVSQLSPQTITQLDTQVRARAITAAIISDAVRSESATNVQAAVDAQVRAIADPALRAAVANQVQAVTQPAVSTAVGTKTPSMPTTGVPGRLKRGEPPPGGQPKRPRASFSLKVRPMGDFEKRKAIKKAKVAIAWRQGELNGQDRWDTIIEPNTPSEQYLIVVGKKPQGAQTFTGARSAIRSAYQLSGGKVPGGLIKAPGAFDVRVEDAPGKAVRLSFVPDRITERRQLISTARPLVSGRRPPRITPARPRIGR